MTSLVSMMAVFVMTSAAQVDIANNGECPSRGNQQTEDELKSVLSLLQTDYQLSGKGHTLAKGDDDCYNSAEATYNWTCEAARVEHDSSHLHVGSGWTYLSDEQYDELVMDATLHMKPPIEDHDTVFELGMGVGAALKVLSTHLPGLRSGGSDLTEGAVKVARKVLQGHGGTLPMLVLDMRSKHDSIPDESFDHVVSYGALAMYIQKDEMLTAIAEAARMTKPGGSLLFTSFVEPGGFEGTIKCPVEKSFWAASLPRLGLEGVEVYGMKNQWDRYTVTCRKKDNPDDKSSSCACLAACLELLPEHLPPSLWQ